MIAPIILTTTNRTETSAYRIDHKRAAGVWPVTKYARILIDAYDILRVIEVPRDKDESGEPVCEVSYTFENTVKDGEDTVVREVAHIKVRHSLDDLVQLMEEAKAEKKDWE